MSDGKEFNRIRGCLSLAAIASGCLCIFLAYKMFVSGIGVERSQTTISIFSIEMTTGTVGGGFILLAAAIFYLAYKLAPNKTKIESSSVTTEPGDGSSGPASSGGGGIGRHSSQAFKGVYHSPPKV